MSISKWWDIFKNYLIHLKKWKKIKLFSGCRDREQNLVLYWGDCVCLLEMFLFLLSLQLLMMMIIIIKRFCFVFLHFAPLPSLPTWIVLLCPGLWWGKKFNSFAIKDFVMRFFLLFYLVSFSPKPPELTLSHADCSSWWYWQNRVLSVFHWQI